MVLERVHVCDETSYFIHKGEAVMERASSKNKVMPDAFKDQSAREARRAKATTFCMISKRFAAVRLNFAEFCWTDAAAISIGARGSYLSEVTNDGEYVTR